MQKTYPNHIYEPIRIEIAGVYLKRELRKYLPSVRGLEVWKKIDSDVDLWFDKSPNIAAVRDFWNGFWGMAMGFKLKVGLIQALTAENIKWELDKNLPLNESLHTGTLPYISKELSEIKPNALFLKSYFEKKPDLAQKLAREFKNHANTSEERDNFPIIALQNPKEKYFSVIDGNRRTALSVLKGKTNISAYIGTYEEGVSPKNFWLPTPYLMELVREGELTDSYKDTLTSLKKVIKLSQSGEFELKDRVLIGSNKFTAELRKGLGW